MVDHIKHGWPAQGLEDCDPNIYCHMSSWCPSVTNSRAETIKIHSPDLRFVVLLNLQPMDVSIWVQYFLKSSQQHFWLVQENHVEKWPTPSNPTTAWEKQCTRVAPPTCTYPLQSQVGCIGLEFKSQFLGVGAFFPVMRNLTGYLWTKNEWSRRIVWATVWASSKSHCRFDYPL